MAEPFVQARLEGVVPCLAGWFIDQQASRVPSFIRDAEGDIADTICGFSANRVGRRGEARLIHVNTLVELGSAATNISNIED